MCREKYIFFGNPNIGKRGKNLYYKDKELENKAKEELSLEKRKSTDKKKRQKRKS